MNGTQNLSSYQSYFSSASSSPKTFPWSRYFTEHEKSVVKNILTNLREQYVLGRNAGDPELHWNLLNSFNEALKNSLGQPRQFANSYNHPTNSALAADFVGDFCTKFHHLVEGTVSNSSRAIIGDYESEAKAKVNFILYMVGLISTR